MKIIQKGHQFGKDKVEVGAMNVFVMTGVSYASKASQPGRPRSHTRPSPSRGLDVFPVRPFILIELTFAMALF
jgi:hypothetical protein